MANPPVPAAFRHLTNLAADATGTFVLASTDDYFAPKENLVRPDAPVWKEGEYTDKGKWMDGWESQRMRGPGHDHCTIRLGTPGTIHGLLVDTTHFKGNAPQRVSLQITEAPFTATPAQLDEARWTDALPETEVKPDFPNVVPLPGVSARATHVRLHIFPDGGVSRLRVYGVVEPEPRAFWREGAIDLLAIEHGGAVAFASDEFFGPPANLLLPGRGVNMGDGWETRRRRTPGSDVCVLRLGRRAQLDRLELDTHFFKGNAPQHVLVEALDLDGLTGEVLQRRVEATEGWHVLVGKSPLVQHRSHVLEPERPMAVTHLRVHIFPHGGVNRLRAYGHALDGPAERAKLAELHALPEGEAVERFLSFNGSRRMATQLAAARPFASVRALFAEAERAWWAASEEDRLEAFAAHPALGEAKATSTQTAASASWSKNEQAGVQAAAEEIKAKLAAANAAYRAAHGFVFLLCATGRSAPEVLQALEERLANGRAEELERAASEQAKITRLRLEKWLLGR